MISIENAEVFGWEAAIRGMRNAMNSWDASDSFFWAIGSGLEEPWGIMETVTDVGVSVSVGQKDSKLMRTLANAGNDHGKFLRMIHVQFDVTAPLYWYKEYDTYKVGTVANSCSTMHKIHAKPFTMDDFSHEHMVSGSKFMLRRIVDMLNEARELFLESKEKVWWWQMIQLLPSSYNQRRTLDVNYQVLRSMYHARKNHKLDEWHTFCDWIRTLPYSELITGEE